MSKTPDDVKKGLKCCAASYADCHKECPYKLDCDGTQILKDALALIQQLQADNAQQARCIENMTDKLNAMNDEVVKLQAERDAALKDVNKNCYTCGVSAEHIHEEPCNSCRRAGGNKENWQWRGATKEE